MDPSKRGREGDEKADQGMKKAKGGRKYMTTLGDILDHPVVASNKPSVICTGHVLSSIVVGPLLRLTGSSANTLSTLLEIIKNDEPGGQNIHRLTRINPSVIDSHKTSVYVYKTKTTTFIWYNNPWGYHADERFLHKRGHDGRDSRSVFDVSTFDKDELELPDKSDPDYVKGHLPVLFKKKPVLENERFLRHVYQMGFLRDHLRATVPPDDFNQARFATRAWEEEHGVVSIYDIMYTLYFLARVYKKNHIRVLSMRESMNKFGPQSLSNDGVDANSYLASYVRRYGTCTTWDRIYNRHAKFLLDDKIDMSDDEVLDIIKGEMIQNYLLGEPNSRTLLGKLGYSCSRLQVPLPFVEKLFELVPAESQVLTKEQLVTGRFRHGRQPFHRKLVRLADALIAEGDKIYKSGGDPSMKKLFVDGLLKEMGMMNGTEGDRVILLDGVRALRRMLGRFAFSAAIDLLYLVVDCKHSSIGSNIIRND